MSDHAQALGKDEAVVQALGKEWRLAAIGPKIKADYCLWLQRSAIKAAVATKDLLPADDYAEQLARIAGDIGAGEYSWGSDRWAKSVNNDAGALELIRLFLLKQHRDVTADQVAEAVAANRADFLAAVRERLGVVPNTPPPTAPGAETPGPST